jgi:hypothetical protein
MSMYFNNCKSIEDLKKEYYRLVKMYHPDLHKGIDDSTIKAINSEYEIYFEKLKNIHNSTHDADHQNTESASEYTDIINKIIHMVGITIEICGTWVWLSGNTKIYKEELKQYGFWWASKKLMWYWHTEQETTGRHKTWSMDKIRDKYGSKIIETEKQYALA